MEKKQKIAILGGGASSLTTALQITEEPNWQEKYEITVYQMGWRLGGKGASGRNPEHANRIEEHGLHLWFGFYDNAFDLMQRVYKANNRPLNKPLATWEEAFKPYGLVVVQENVSEQWRHWPFQFPHNKETPGLGGPPVSLWSQLKAALAILHDQHLQYFDKMKQEVIEKKHDPADQQHHHGLLNHILEFFGIHGTKPDSNKIDDLMNDVESWFKKIEKEAEVLSIEVTARLIYTAMQFMNSVEEHTIFHHSILLKFIDKILQNTWNKIQFDLDKDPDTRKFWIITDFILTSIKGMVEDGVLTKGFDVINNIDYRDWLQKHGATRITLESALVQAVYIIVFGGYKYYSFEAGTALKGILKMSLQYKGALYYRMQAGMGDTIFGPIYEVLKARGVKFEFFHKVKNLKLSDDKKFVEEVEMNVQATIKDGAEYQPLFDVKGLPCWPSYPLYDQIDQGEELRSQKINLESYWTPWKDVGQKSLKYGIDYDILVQGISIGALPVIASEILASNEKWKTMVEKVTACETLAFQLWLYPDLAGLGWPYWTGDLPMTGSYIEPFDTWADMSDLIIRESWPDNAFPNNIAYMCGPINRRVDYSKWNFNDHSVPGEIYEYVKEKTKTFLNESSHHLWKNASDANGFNYDLLVDLENGSKEERFNNQWFKGNIDPSELYVLSVTDSGKYRLKTDESGYENMYITGDWINVGFNAGCVEVAVMAGKQTARAILKQDFEIKGEKDYL